MSTYVLLGPKNYYELRSKVTKSDTWIVHSSLKLKKKKTDIIWVAAEVCGILGLWNRTQMPSLY